MIAAKRPEQKIGILGRLLRRKKTDERGYIGITILPVLEIKPSVVAVVGETFPWMLAKQLTWIYLLNLFIGITNLLPIFPLDGGKIFEEIVKKVSPGSARQITNMMFALVLLLVFINISPFLRIFI